MDYREGWAAGRLSQRTDGGSGGQVYGEGKFMDTGVACSVLLSPFPPAPALWRRTSQ